MRLNTAFKSLRSVWMGKINLLFRAGRNQIILDESSEEFGLVLANI